MRFSMLTKKERARAQAYAKRHALTLTEGFKRSLLENIEDEEDARLAEEALEEYVRDPETISHEEVGKMLGLR